jgi:hypothetical protein
MPPRGVSTPKSRAAARRNGIKGGPHGKKGGRPRGAFPAELLQEIGPPPVGKPLKLARWWTALLAQGAWLQAQGQQGIKTLMPALISAAKAAGTVLPHDIMFAAAQIVKDDQEGLEQAGRGPEVVTREETDGPRSAGTGRRDPR